MKLSYTTLACPQWDLDQICKAAADNGYDGIDFRGYLTEIDISRHPLFAGDEAWKVISGYGLTVSGVSSSIKICDLPNQSAALEEARRTVEVCQRLNAAHVRVFGGGDSATLPRPELAAAGRDTMEKILQIDGAENISWDFETHDVWVEAKDCRLLMDLIPLPQFNLLWDMGNALMSTSDTVEEVWQMVGDRMAYTHIKDVVKASAEQPADYAGWHYVLPGTGELPLAHAVRFLRQQGYHSWLVLEHEKRWHPTLPDPEMVIPAFAAWIRTL